MRSTILWSCALVGCGGAQPAPLSSSSPTAQSGPPASGQLCDDGERVFVVDAHPVGEPVIGARDATTTLTGTVVAISHADGKRIDGPIDATSASIDNCGGTGGGHAGCSMSGGSSIHSALLGADTLFFGVTHRNSLMRGDAMRACRGADEEDPWLDACATKSWFVVIGRSGDDAYIRVFAGAGVAGDQPETPTLQETVQPGDRHYAGKRAVLDTRAGTVEFDGHREPCLAVYRPKS
jgi:hypothetical protein